MSALVRTGGEPLTEPEVRTVVVFGANGFLGAHLGSALVAAGYRVLALTRRNATYSLPCYATPNPSIVRICWEAPEELERAAGLAATPCAFFHVAANINVGASLQKPEEFISGNLEVTLNSLKVARHYWPDAPSVFLSSDRVFGRTEGAAHEASQPCPVDPYGLSKYFSEEACKYYARLAGARTVIVRASNIYGPFQTSSQFVPSLFRRFWAGEREIRVGDLRVKRNYLEIQDLVDGLTCLVKNIAKSPNVLHFGNRLISLGDVAQTFEQSAKNFTGEAVNIVGDLSQSRPHGTELTEFDFRCDVANKFLSWVPRVEINQGIDRIFKEEGAKWNLLKSK